MKRFAIRILCALTVAAVLCPIVCHASGKNTANEDLQRAVNLQLASTVPVNFIDNTLINVATFFHDVTGFPIEMDWRELEKWNIPKDTLVNLRLSNVPSGRAIELMVLSAAGDRLVLLLDNGKKLHITMRRKAEHMVEVDPDRWSYWCAQPSPGDVDEPTPQAVAVAKMGEIIPWDFEKNMAVNVFDYIRNMAGTSLYVDWKSLTKVDVERESRVTGTGDPKATSEVLDTVLATLSDDLAWRVDDFGVVIIATRDVLDGIVPLVEGRGGGKAEGADN